MNTTPTASSIVASPKRSTGRIVAAVTAFGLATAAVCSAAVIAFGTQSSHAATQSHTTAVVHPSRPSHAPSVTPSANVKLLQQQLGDLNYYSGPIDGIEGGQTIAAIRYLQRDAHLPQTGVLDRATINAMDHMLATGNNVMGAN